MSEENNFDGEVGESESDGIKELETESLEIAKILGKIVTKIKQ